MATAYPTVHGLEFSPDGKTLVSASYDETLRLWDVATREPIGVPLTGHGKPVFHVAFSPDGKTVASSDGTTIRLWDVATQRQSGDAITPPPDAGYRIAFSMDGTRLALASGRQLVYLWDVATRRHIAAPPDGPDTGFVENFSPDGATLAVAREEEDIQFWDVAGRRLVGTLPRPAGHFSRLAMSEHGRTVAVVGLDAQFRWVVELWDVERRERIGDPLQGRSERIEAAAFSPGGRFFATGGYDRTVRIYGIVH